MELKNAPKIHLIDPTKHALMIGGTAEQRETIMKDLVSEAVSRHQEAFYLLENENTNTEITKIHEFCLSRYDQKSETRQPINLFVQAHTPAINSWDKLIEILSESRMMKISIVISVPAYSLLSDDMKMSALGNIATLISLELSNEKDAVEISKMLGANVTKEELLHMPAGEALVSYMTDSVSVSKVRYQ